MYSSCVCGFMYFIYITHLFCVCIFLLCVNLMYFMCEFFNCVWICLKFDVDLRISLLISHYSSIPCVYSSFVCGFDVLHVWILQLCVNLCEFFFCAWICLPILVSSVYYSFVRAFNVLHVGILLLCVNLLAYHRTNYFNCVFFFCVNLMYFVGILLLCVNLLTYIRLWYISSLYSLFVSEFTVFYVSILLGCVDLLTCIRTIYFMSSLLLCVNLLTYIRLMYFKCVFFFCVWICCISCEYSAFVREFAYPY